MTKKQTVGITHYNAFYSKKVYFSEAKLAILLKSTKIQGITANKTTMIGKISHRFDVLASTNDFARELLSKSEPVEGTAIIAASQSAGRGQFGSTWTSEAGKNLLVSVILYPNFLPPTRQFLLSQVAALAVQEAVAQWVPSKVVSIKWPNDILIDGKKVSGILIQNALAGSSFLNSVVGIGLNVNQLAFGAHLPQATSLALQIGGPVPLESVENSLFAALDAWYNRLKWGETDRIVKNYRQHLYKAGEETAFMTADGANFTGTIVELDQQGRLGILREKEVVYFGLKEVSLLPDQSS